MSFHLVISRLFNVGHSKVLCNASRVSSIGHCVEAKFVTLQPFSPRTEDASFAAVGNTMTDGILSSLVA